MPLAHGILGLLHYGSMSGYDLSKAFRASVNLFWHAQTSQIYATLDKLERAGLISHQVIVQRDRPSKKLFSHTQDGEQELARWLNEPDGGALLVKSEMLMKVFFSGALPPERTAERLQCLLAECDARVQEFDAARADSEEYRPGLEAESLYWDMAADFNRQYIRMCRAWAQDCLQRLPRDTTEAKED